MRLLVCAPVMKLRQTCHRAQCVPLNYAVLLFAHLLSLPYLVALHSTLSLNSGIVTLIKFNNIDLLQIGDSLYMLLLLIVQKNVISPLVCIIT